MNNKIGNLSTTMTTEQSNIAAAVEQETVEMLRSQHRNYRNCGL